MIGNITAQRSGFGIHAGLVGTEFYTIADGANIEFETNSGIMVGVRYNLKLGPVGFCTELNYVSQKIDQIGETTYDMLGNTSLYEYANPVEWTVNYLSMPLLLKLYLGPINVHTGVQASFLLDGSLKDDELNINNDLDDEEFTLDINGKEYSFWEDMDIAAVFGIGVDLKMGLYIAARATVSVTPFLNMELVTDTATELGVSEDIVADGFNAGFSDGEGVDGLNRFVTTQLIIGYSC